MAMDVSVEIHCGTCGSANYSLPPDAVADTGIVVCNDCDDALGTVAELRNELLGQAIARSAEMLRRELDLIAQPPPGDSGPA